MLGIQKHLHDSPASLAQSASYFEASATLNGGCGFGMLMWGLTLRHGWGVQSDAQQGFAWLKRACELAVGDLEGLEMTNQRSINKLSQMKGKLRQEVKTELTLAIYEVGQCFFQGWGVPRDRVMGFVCTRAL
jgi:TPR repeat protein